MAETDNIDKRRQKVSALYNLKDKQSQKALKEIYANLNGMYKGIQTQRILLSCRRKGYAKTFQGEYRCIHGTKDCTRVWKSIERLLFGDGETVHF